MLCIVRALDDRITCPGVHQSAMPWPSPARAAAGAFDDDCGALAVRPYCWSVYTPYALTLPAVSSQTMSPL